MPLAGEFESLSLPSSARTTSRRSDADADCNPNFEPRHFLLLLAGGVRSHGPWQQIARAELSLAQMAGTPVPPSRNPESRGHQREGTMTKAEGEPSRKGIHLVRADRRTRRADGRSAE